VFVKPLTSNPIHAMPTMEELYVAGDSWGLLVGMAAGAVVRFSMSVVTDSVFKFAVALGADLLVGVLAFVLYQRFDTRTEETNAPTSLISIAISPCLLAAIFVFRDGRKLLELL
jgi:hypothetical protein